MGKKNKADRGGFVYSTDPGFRFEHEHSGEEETLKPELQKLRIWLETKHRGGKAVTVVAGFQGKQEDLVSLEKQLKNFCGTGGSSKDGEILIQGDQSQKILQWLISKGYKQTKRAGC